MLEILFLIAFTKKIGEIVGQKGYPPGGYKLLAVLFCFGGELLGATMSAAIATGPAIYLTALIGAIIGALSIYTIARSKPHLHPGWRVELHERTSPISQPQCLRSMAPLRIPSRTPRCLPVLPSRTWHLHADRNPRPLRRAVIQPARAHRGRDYRGSAAAAAAAGRHRMPEQCGAGPRPELASRHLNQRRRYCACNDDRCDGTLGK